MWYAIDEDQTLSANSKRDLIEDLAGRCLAVKKRVKRLDTGLYDLRMTSCDGDAHSYWLVSEEALSKRPDMAWHKEEAESIY